MKQLNNKRLVLILLIILTLFFVHEPADTRDSGVSSYECTYTENIEGNIQTISYTDSSGNSVATTNNAWTIIERELDSNGNNILEHYYDIDHNPISMWAGYYGIKREYNSDNECISYSYLDSHDEVMNCLYINYSTVKRTFDDSHRCIQELFYDTSGMNIADGSGYYGQQMEYIEDSWLVSTYTYLDKELNSVYTIQRTYDDTNRVSTEMYSTSNDLGIYGCKYTYDEYGRVDTITYLDQNKTITSCNKGYSIVERTYFKNNNVKSEMYYDIHHSPVHLDRGQSGILYTSSQTQYLDEEGNVLFLPDIYLRSNPYISICICIGIVFLSKYGSKKHNIYLFILYSLFMIYMTLLNRSNVDTSIQMNIFYTFKQFFSSYTTRIFIIENIVLFIPFSSILYKLYPKKRILLLCILCSICIEYIQYTFGIGVADIDDVLANSIGSLLGILINKD